MGLPAVCAHGEPQRRLWVVRFWIDDDVVRAYLLEREGECSLTLRDTALETRPARRQVVMVVQMRSCGSWY